MKRHTVIAVIALLVTTILAGAVGAAEKKKTKKKSSNIGATANVQTLTNSIGMKFVKVPAGSFVMGTRVDQPDCPEPDPFTSRVAYDACMKRSREAKPFENETPAHNVTISTDFWIGQYEVTQAQWYAVMGNNPSEFKSDKVGEDSRNFPVENVSWYDAQEFISRLNAKEGKQYRLPTEAEWEYACKSCGKDQKYCGGNDLSAVAWYVGNSGNRTHRVGTKKPNGLGIYDMSGNVWEWVSDWYGENYYGNSSDSDPHGPSGGERRVNRGGSWDNGADFARSYFRDYRSPDYRYNGIGFRLVSP